MRTIPAAMTWELLTRVRWNIFAATLGAIAFPAIILTALNADGAVDPRDPDMLRLHMFLSQIAMFVIAVAVLSSQGQISRLFAYPARTSTLVAWRMVPAMATIALATAIATTVLNAIFELGWPILGTALFLAVGVAAVQAAIWISGKSLWILVAITVVATVLGLWLKSRYGPIFGDPTHMWTHISSFDAATLAVAVIISYATAVVGVARSRRGDPPPSLGIIDGLGRLFARTPSIVGPFTSPLQAQLWFEWQRKGRLMPAAVVLGLLAGLIVWVFSSRDPQELFEGLVGGGSMLTGIGFLGGLLLGNIGPDDGSYPISGFFSSRPMTNAELARVILVTAAKSLLFAWLLWAAPVLATFIALALTDSLPSPVLPKEFGWWYFPATLLGPWIAIALCMPAGLSGRITLFIKLVCAVASAFIALATVSAFALNQRTQSQLEYATAAIIGLVLTGGTIWLYAAARHREMVHLSTVIAAALTWVAASAVVFAQWPLADEPRLPAYLLLTGILGVAVAPFAAAPLAIAWNRHR